MKRAADVDVGVDSREQQGDAAVHEHAGGGDVHHELGLHRLGRGEAVHGFDGDPDGEDEQRRGIHKCGEHSGALIAEGLGVGRGTALEVDGDEGEQQRERVRNVVPGLGDERERMGAESGDEGHDDIGQRQHQGEPQDVLHLRVGR